MMRRKKQLASLAMAGLLGIASVAPAWGATGPGVTEDPYHGYGEEKWAALSDNVLEYDELPDLIWSFNPSIVAGDSAVKSGIDLTKMAAEGFYSDSRSYKDEADEAMKDGQMDKYVEKLIASKIAKATGDKMSKTATYTERISSSSYKSIRKAQKMMTNGAQQMMIGYNSAVAQRATVAKMKELYSSTYDATVLQKQLGMATETDVMTAKTNLLSSETTLTRLDNSIDSLRRSLCMMTGWPADAQPDIRPLPAIDMERIGNINQEQDIIKAIGNNYTLIDQRHMKPNSTATQDNKTRLTEEGEQKLRIEMQSLYQDVLQKKAAYESAQTALQSASIAKAAADRQYQLGMTSKLQNLGQQLSYLQSEGSAKSAEIDLVQALQTYDQAIDGFATIE